MTNQSLLKKLKDRLNKQDNWYSTEDENYFEKEFHAILIEFKNSRGKKAKQRKQ